MAAHNGQPKNLFPTNDKFIDAIQKKVTSNLIMQIAITNYLTFLQVR